MERGPALWWVRRDVRLKDNPALQAALKIGGGVIPVFVLDRRLMGSRMMSRRRAVFLFEGLRALDRDLRDRGGSLVVREGDPAVELAQLVEETDARGVYAAEDFSGYARQRDAQVAKSVRVEFTGGTAIKHPLEVLKDNGQPYTVYTPYMKAWKRTGLPSGDGAPEPEYFAQPRGIRSVGLPEGGAEEGFPAGEAEARKRLAKFAEEGGLANYSTGRDQMGSLGTAGVSPYLRFGMLSPREAASVAVAAMRAFSGEAQRGAEVWLNELIWRDFYLAILYHYPRVSKGAFRKELQAIGWENDEENIRAWKEGRTGIPIVDAGMRQLRETGWMHNRARMITASFLVKNLLVDWRIGEQWFMENLLDGEPAANNGGWQWTAGTGTDAAPYFRVFNPVLQGRRFDADGDYVRRWVPELARVPLRYLHAPWEMPEKEQRLAGCVLEKDYPRPAVELGVSRLRALAAYKDARSKDS